MSERRRWADLKKNSLVIIKINDMYVMSGIFLKIEDIFFVLKVRHHKFYIPTCLITSFTVYGQLPKHDKRKNPNRLVQGKKK